MLARMVFRVSKVSVVISARKGIRAVKGLREISGQQGLLGQRDLPDPQGHSGMYGFKAREVFRVRQGQPAQLALWDRKA